ncbi:hypothetical protein GUJ93_ZPchr0006g42234 [Zizania palustris]|uniref:Uncharacterized protein n=1 Tax=Zizania palustris TaxID=103762 RepID=A0A8J5SCV0_ZIZPA|nr:hypothetical protein GUJ93_ZPchr0006g42234 [Zizania palustris]
MRVLETLPVARPHLNIRGFYTREARESGERVAARLLLGFQVSPESIKWPTAGKYKVDVYLVAFFHISASHNSNTKTWPIHSWSCEVEESFNHPGAVIYTLNADNRDAIRECVYIQLTSLFKKDILTSYFNARFGACLEKIKIMKKQPRRWR